jgi:hypothetical protein
MAVAIVMDWAEGTLEQYDEIIGKMGFEPGGTGPPSSVFHWVAKNGDGIRVVDVWETREAFDAFAQDQIGPLTQEAGLGEPQMAFFEVHNTLAAP